MPSDAAFREALTDLELAYGILHMVSNPYAQKLASAEIERLSAHVLALYAARQVSATEEAGPAPVVQEKPMVLANVYNEAVRQNDLLVAELNRLYAERQGEVCEVRRQWSTAKTGHMQEEYVVVVNDYKPGDRVVRVVRVECWRDTAGRAHPKEGV